MKPEFSRSAQSVPPRAHPLLTEDQRAHLFHLRTAGAMLVMSDKMPKAAIVVSKSGQDPVHLATLDRAQASELADRGWVAGDTDGRMSRLRLTREGLHILQLATARGENAALGHGDDHDDETDESGQCNRRRRHSPSETPILALARRRDKNGKPFLSKDLLRAGDRLREDFESDHIGARTTQDWDQMLSGSLKGDGYATATLPGLAADRFRNALSELGPGLAEIALLCCCYQEGLENAEKKMGWSARSAKIVLRIALQRLRRYYDELGESGEFIG